MAVRTAVYDPVDQATRRKRARVTQRDIARRLNIPSSRISEYENAKNRKTLPWGLTPEDYERALTQAIGEKLQVSA